MKKSLLVFFKTLITTTVIFLVGSCDLANLDDDTAPAPEASFTFTVDSSNPLRVSFQNNSTDATSYVWAFGDGETSTSQNPTHVYSESGRYTVKLTAVGEGGTDESSSTITIEEDAEPPVAGFSYSADENVVSFTNESTNASTFSWDFGDGTTSTATNPNKTYSEEGNYTVTLTATGEGGTDDFSTTVSITIPAEAPVAAFSYSVSDYDVSFTNQSTNATSYSWNFGDGTSSTQMSPNKSYSENGTYTVSLTASGEGGSNTTSKQVTINVAAINLPNLFIGRWYNVAGTWVYGIDEDSNGKYIRTGNQFYYYDPTRHVSVTRSGGKDIYEVRGTNTSGTSRTFWLKARGSAGNNIIDISQTSASSGFTEFGTVVGRNVAYALCTNDITFVKTGSTSWEERRPDGSVNARFTEYQRDDWSVYMEKSDGARIAIDVFTFKVKFRSVSSSSFSDLYTIERATN